LNVQNPRLLVPITGQSPRDGNAARPKRPRVSRMARLRHWLARVFMPFKHHAPPNGVTPAEAVTSFLGTMSANATRTSAGWLKTLGTGLEDCGIGYEARYDFFEKTPVEDYYFAGIVAMEAARIRTLFAPAEANAILAEIAEQVDRHARRPDRVLSEMVFELIGRINVSSTPTQQKKPYDIAVKVILEKLDFHANETTEPLMHDKAFRLALSEPLAVGFRDWWSALQERFVLYLPPEVEEEPEDDQTLLRQAAPAPLKRPWRPKRAATF